MKYNSMMTCKQALKLIFKSAFKLSITFTSLCLLTNHHAFAADSSNQSKANDDRWFEIEVILFKQKANNLDNNEQFSSSDINIKKRPVFDLLAPYLQPSIASLKQLLPDCEKPEVKSPYNITLTPYDLWNEKASAVNIKASANEIKVTNTQPAIIGLPVYTQYPISSQTPLCIIPTASLQQHLTMEQLENFNIDGFPVEKLTTTVDGIEQWQDNESGEITWASNTPYLISNSSLRLNAIMNSIKRSRHYTPLLHLGWRQIGESRKKAKAIKLYAGENLALNYQQSITQKNKKLKTLELQAILEQRNTGNHLTIDRLEESNALSIIEQLKEQAKQQKLNDILQQFSRLNKIDEIRNSDDFEQSTYNEDEINRIITGLSYDITAPKSLLSSNNIAEVETKIIEPLQPWSVDGLFKVHLDHYLYINSEFNILTPSPTKASLRFKGKENNESNSTKSDITSFKQDRRVITGEIHYFDHPNIGMFVQIRRFDATKPAAEAVTQSKK